MKRITKIRLLCTTYLTNSLVVEMWKLKSRMELLWFITLDHTNICFPQAAYESSIIYKITLEIISTNQNE